MSEASDHNKSSDHEFLTTEETAAYLRVSQHTVWRWCQEGHLPAFQIGRTWRIRKDELEELIKNSGAGEVEKGIREEGKKGKRE